MISATIRDIAIIVIAFQSIVIGVLLGVLIWQIWRLVKLVQTEIKPIVEDTQETVNTVRGTTTFLSHNLVEPVVQSNRKMTRWRHTVQALVRDMRGDSPPATPPPTPPPTTPPPPTPPLDTPRPHTPTPETASPDTPPPAGPPDGVRR